MTFCSRASKFSTSSVGKVVGCLVSTVSAWKSWIDTVVVSVHIKTKGDHDISGVYSEREAFRQPRLGTHPQVRTKAAYDVSHFDADLQMTRNVRKQLSDLLLEYKLETRRESCPRPLQRVLAVTATSQTGISITRLFQALARSSRHSGLLTKTVQSFL